MATTQADPNQPSSAEQNAGAIPSGGGSTGAVQSPLGVPYYVTDPNTGQPLIGPNGQPVRWGATVQSNETYVRRFGGETAKPPQYVLPRYFDGDQWIPASMPPDQLAGLQRRMVQAGLLKPGQAQLGVWDAVSMDAYTRLLAFANASGLLAEQALDRWGQAHAADPNAGRAPLTKQVSSLEELRPAIRKAFIDTLGAGISQDQIDRLAGEYQRIQGGAQEQAYNMQDTGGTVVQPPSADAFAVAKAKEQNPLGAQEHDLIGQGGPLDSFRSLIGGWSQ